MAEAIFLKEGRAQNVAWRDADKVLALSPMNWGSREKTPLVSQYYFSITDAALAVLREPDMNIIMRIAGETGMRPSEVDLAVTKYIEAILKEPQ